MVAGIRAGFGLVVAFVALGAGYMVVGGILRAVLIGLGVVLGEVARSF
jgi:hypothetical protein